MICSRTFLSYSELLLSIAVMQWPGDMGPPSGDVLKTKMTDLAAFEDLPGYTHNRQAASPNRLT